MPSLFDGGSAAVQIFKSLLASIAGAGNIGTASGATVEVALGQKLAKASNLSDLVDAGAALSNLGLLNLTSVTAVNAAQTLPLSALGTVVVVSDSVAPANYQLTLPGVAPNNSVIFVYIATTFTKALTLHGNDTGINGQPYQKMWAGEYCLLQKTSGNWRKIGGRSIPLIGGAKRTATLAITADTLTIVPMQTATGDPTALNLCYDAASGQFSAMRRGEYLIRAGMSFAAGTTATHVEFAIQDTAAAADAAALTCPSAIAQTYIDVTGSTVPRLSGHPQSPFFIAEGRYARPVVRANGAAGTIDYAASANIQATLAWTEIPIW